MDSKAEKVVKNLSNIIFDLRTENESLYDTVEIYSKRIDELKAENEQLRTELNSTKLKIEKAVEYYKMHQQECVIGRNKDDKLIKDYYLPARCSKVLLNILQNGSDEE